MSSVVFIGNPGVGKSTLLNCLLQHAEFQSGNSRDGAGVTRVKKQCAWEGITLVDLPGLDSVREKERAAKEITEALKTPGLIKVVFVLTLEAQRVRQADQATLQLVLNAVPQLAADSYGVILNKLTPEGLKDLESETAGSPILSNIMPDRRSKHVHLVGSYHALVDGKNAITAIPGLSDFIGRITPGCTGPVSDIEPRTFLQVLGELAESEDRARAAEKKAAQARAELAARDLGYATVVVGGSGACTLLAGTSLGGFADVLPNVIRAPLALGGAVATSTGLAMVTGASALALLHIFDRGGRRARAERLWAVTRRVAY